MNINNILKQLADIPEQLEHTADRRNLLKSAGAKIAYAAVPFVAASMFSGKAYGQSKETIINRLNYLLKLEYIVHYFYTKAFEVDTLFPPETKAIFQKVMAQNELHITALKNLVTESGGVIFELDTAEIDLTGGSGSNAGPFSKAITDPKEFLILAQLLSDAGCRIYKGQITELLSDRVTVRAMMTIHSVKARQAAFVRNMRSYWQGAHSKPWITGTNTDNENTSTQKGYAGESATTQAGINIIGINGYEISTDSASQSFDEPLTQADGLAIIQRFISL